MQDRGKRERSPKHRKNEREQKRSVPPLRRDIQNENRVTREVLMISGGPTDGDSANARKTSFKKASHEVLRGYLRPDEE